MFAVIKLSGKQFHVKEGDVIFTDRLENEIGDVVTTSDVLASGEGANLKVGEPLVKDAVVKFEVLEHLKDEKLLIFKKKRRKNHRRKNGHRQMITKLKILNIEG